MEPHCIPHTELPHTTRLFCDFLYHFDRVARFYDSSAHDPSSYREAAARIQYPDDRREALVSALRQNNGDSPALELLARPGTLAVVTGQQVGLYSGPAYTIYKALTAARLARQLSAEGIPAVPVFWLATEDHDIEEVNHCWVFDATHRPVRLNARTLNQPQTPAGSVAIEESPTAGLRSAVGGFPFADQVIALVQSTYAPGRSMGAAFLDILKQLLAGYGLLFLDPLQPGIRRLAAPILGEAVRKIPELTGLLVERNKALEEAGYHAQVLVEPGSSLMFLLDGGRRLPLRRENGAYSAGGRRYSVDELSSRAEDLSPNALLRPVMEDYLLPSVAYVGGPAEVAYMAQAQVLYRALLGRMPVVVHRNSFTLLDARGEKLFRRYGLGLADFFRGEEALRERIASKLIPPVLAGSFEEAKSRAAKQLDLLGAELASFDATLAAALETSRRKILYQFSKIERKTARESLRRSEGAARDASSLSGLVYPERHMQERLYSIIPFLARHGFDLIPRIYENVRLDCPDHKMLVV